MGDADHENHEAIVVDVIEDAVIADAYAPHSPAIRQELGRRWPGLSGQAVDRPADLLLSATWELGELTPCARDEID